MIPSLLVLSHVINRKPNLMNCAEHASIRYKKLLRIFSANLMLARLGRMMDEFTDYIVAESVVLVGKKNKVMPHLINLRAIH